MLSTQQHSAQPVIHVALVEDDTSFRNAMIASLRQADDIRLVNVAGTCADGMRMLDEAPADVLLVDLGLPDGSGIDIIRSAREKWPVCGSMVCTTFGDEAHVIRSIEAGAVGYLLKDSEPGNMLNEIRSLNGGGSPISPLIARRILTQFRDETASAPVPERVVLSARELQVLELITKGFTAEEIACLMQVSRHTVLTFVRRIYSRTHFISCRDTRTGRSGRWQDA